VSRNIKHGGSMLRPVRRAVPLMAVVALVLLGSALTAQPAAAANEMSLGVQAAPNVSCDDPANPTTCDVDAGTTFTLAVRVDTLPPPGYYIAFESYIDYDGLTYLPTGTAGEEIVWPDGGALPMRAIGATYVQHADMTALLPPFPHSTYTGNIVEILLQCPDTEGSHQVNLGPDNTDLLDEDGIPYPSSDSLTINCEAQPELGDTHYQCYDIFPPQWPGVPFLFLRTQFGDDLVEVGDSAQLCAPAIKNGEGDLLDPHLKCYDIWGSDPDVVVNLETQFGTEQNVEVGPARKLCVGASKWVTFPTKVCCGFCPQYPMCFDTTNPLVCQAYGCLSMPGYTCVDPSNPDLCVPIPTPDPPAPIAYECFDISATGHDPPDVVAILQDQFGWTFGVGVGPAELLCAPALMDGIGTLDLPHLKCYQIPPFFPGEYWLNLETLFDTEVDVQLGESRWLCTEALKDVVECIDRLGDTACDDPVNDPDDDGCSSWEEQAGAPGNKPGSTGAYDPTAWYDFYDVPVPAKADAVGANGKRNRAVTLGDVLAVLLYVNTVDNGGPNVNGVDYDTVKGVDLDGDTDDDAPYSHGIEEGLKYDRSVSPAPNPPWNAGPPNGAINMSDVLAALAQVGLACTGGPPP
jgi:hypothetical protein